MKLDKSMTRIAEPQEWYENYAGIGHNSAYTVDGVDYLIAHAYDLRDQGRSKLLIRPLTWDAAGWPIVTLEGVANGHEVVNSGISPGERR